MRLARITGLETAYTQTRCVFSLSPQERIIVSLVKLSFFRRVASGESAAAQIYEEKSQRFLTRY